MSHHDPLLSKSLSINPAQVTRRTALWWGAAGLGALCLPAAACSSPKGTPPATPSRPSKAQTGQRPQSPLAKAHTTPQGAVAPPLKKWPGVARGVAWDANWENQQHWYGTPAAEAGLDHLKRLHGDWIAITPFSFQRDIKKPDINFRPQWGLNLAQDVKNAHDRKIKVMVKPHIWSNQFWDGSGAWRGHIRMQSDAEWATWFENYTRWIVHVAKQAQALNADAFCVGLEYLESSRAHAARWRDVIKQVRAVYDGPLTYAAHSSELDLPFWDDLDVIGFNAYEPLAQNTQPTAQELSDSWARHAVELSKLSTRWKRPIVFTEVGYASIDGAAQAPFRWPTDQDTEDQDEQAACYQALFDHAPNWPWFAGMFIWKYKIGVERNNVAERQYVFQGKRAEAIVKAGFKKLL